jgi:hypothetical protein
MVSSNAICGNRCAASRSGTSSIARCSARNATADVRPNESSAPNIHSAPVGLNNPRCQRASCARQRSSARIAIFVYTVLDP